MFALETLIDRWVYCVLPPMMIFSVRSFFQFLDCSSSVFEQMSALMIGYWQHFCRSAVSYQPPIFTGKTVKPMTIDKTPTLKNDFQQHQLIRGGGSMCLRDSQLHSIFTEMTEDYYKCNPPPPPPADHLINNRVPES